MVPVAVGGVEVGGALFELFAEFLGELWIFERGRVRKELGNLCAAGFDGGDLLLGGLEFFLERFNLGGRGALRPPSSWKRGRRARP